LNRAWSGGWLATPLLDSKGLERMTVQTFRDLLAARPFKPFRVVMSSGQSHEVRHPEMAMLTRTSMLVGVDIADDGVPAEFKICSLLHVTAVEPLSPAPTGSSAIESPDPLD
jgi:hypothetical protein